jgi:hypothetical protein
MTMTIRRLSASDRAEYLRGAIARSGIPIYVIGGTARINPIRLSRLLHGHARITDDIATRILKAVAKEKATSRYSKEERR